MAGRVRQAEPLLHEVHAQHGLQRKGRATVAPFAAVRGDELDQGSPRNHTFHLLQKYLLAGLTRTQAQVMAVLFHGAEVCHAWLATATLPEWFCRVSLRHWCAKVCALRVFSTPCQSLSRLLET